jgi:hypothetical protein
MRSRTMSNCRPLLRSRLGKLLQTLEAFFANSI